MERLTQEQLDKLLVQAYTADALFQKALEHKYKERAGDMRYQRYAQPEEIRKLGDNYRAIIAEWQAAYQAMRTDFREGRNV